MKAGEIKMDYREQIALYKPFNQQEVNDKKTILDLMTVHCNLLSRKNETAHFTVSAWVVNKDFTKIVMAYHNIYQSWSWLGGHADREKDFLQVALREVNEETGLNCLQAVSSEIFSLEVLDVSAHVKHEKIVPAHLHLNATFLILADEKEKLRIKPDENSAIAWVQLKDVAEKSEEPMMKPIYEKLNKKMQQLKKNKE